MDITSKLPSEVAKNIFYNTWNSTPHKTTLKFQKYGNLEVLKLFPKEKSKSRLLITFMEVLKAKALNGSVYKWKYSVSGHFSEKLKNFALRIMELGYVKAGNPCLICGFQAK